MECALSRELVVRVSRDPAIRRLEMRMTELEMEVAEMEVVETELKEANKERADILSNLQAQPFYNVDP
ncbi:hypothetical protein MLD38_036352 [Melastoma candidum]|uniref:Uncharacterized protein n=1 Tax=Melastoma candidum TaxID=119954 RepID=A0ACB9LJP2_9MYRT|nr:hypothetical protein MLD38_036352 [Melastoma candidum]